MVHRAAQPPCSTPPFAPRIFRASPRPSAFPFSAIHSQTTRSHVHTVRAYPVGVREKRPLHLAFADRAVGNIGRQFSYKQNAEEGVRLDEKRGTLDRGRKGGWRRSFVVGCEWCHRGFPGPSCSLYGRSVAIPGRCVRICIRSRVGIRMSCRFFDRLPLAYQAEPGRIDAPSDHRCARIDRPRDSAFLRVLHPDDTAAAHRGGRTTAPAGIRRARAGCRPGAVAHARLHGKTSVGAARRDS